MPKPRKAVIEFEAALQQSTPGAKPIKFGPEGDSTITFEADASQMNEIKKLVGQYGVIFKISLEVAN